MTVCTPAPVPPVFLAFHPSILCVLPVLSLGLSHPDRQIQESAGGPTVLACGPAVLILCHTRPPVVRSVL